jgi:hypothetical protein
MITTGKLEYVHIDGIHELVFRVESSVNDLVKFVDVLLDIIVIGVSVF